MTGSQKKLYLSVELIKCICEMNYCLGELWKVSLEHFFIFGYVKEELLLRN